MKFGVILDSHIEKWDLIRYVEELESLFTINGEQSILQPQSKLQSNLRNEAESHGHRKKFAPASRRD